MHKDPLIMSDERLHHLGEVYLANPQIRRRGVLFETFLRFPDEIIRAVVYGCAGERADDEPGDLLPAQERVLIRTAALKAA